MFVNALLRRSDKIPLDYILPTKSSLDEKVQSGLERATNHRRVVLKNLCFVRITAIRERKRKPKLRDLLKLVRENPNVNKDDILNKLIQLYSNKNATLVTEDEKFDKMSGYFDRMKKVFQIHQETLGDIDQKLNQLMKRRQDRENAGE